MTLSVLETGLPMQRSHDTLAFGIWTKNWCLGFDRMRGLTHSGHRGGVADTPRQTPLTGRQNPSPGQTPLLGRHTPGQTPLGRHPRADTPLWQMTTIVEGTHPAYMAKLLTCKPSGTWSKLSFVLQNIEHVALAISATISITISFKFSCFFANDRWRSGNPRTDKRSNRHQCEETNVHRRRNNHSLAERFSTYQRFLSLSWTIRSKIPFYKIKTECQWLVLCCTHSNKGTSSANHLKVKGVIHLGFLRQVICQIRQV